VSTPVEACNNTSVGIVVRRAGQLLLIERRKRPYGWAPPAGHVNDGETYLQAGLRELREEVGLGATHLTLIHRATYGNRCRRPGGDWHDWKVYDAVTAGEPVRSADETRALRWATPAELAELVAITRQHLAMGSGPEEWEHRPGLEPVWLEMLTQVGVVGPGAVSW
jgi:ADP-ribose pyrophosphatase YjhB (NUDIX family)